jgi:3-oxoacyl-[acyl-carrier protein] reductase
MNIRKIIDNAKQLCLFGVGTLLNECYDQLVFFLGREPDFLCDNASGKWGATFHGRTCISPDELKRRKNGTTVVITVRQYEEISRQLSGMGISNILTSSFDSGYYQLRGIRWLEQDPATPCGQEFSTVGLGGKWTLVTGASRGVGRQIAMAMARLGSNIIAHSRCVSHTQELMDTCAPWGVQIVPVAAELSNPAELEAMLAQLDTITPQIDIVFNNAAIAPYSPSGFWEIAADIYRDCYAVNTIAPIRICRHLIPPMIRRGFGRVVNVSTHIQIQPGEMAYAISKAALDKFVYDMAPTLQGTGVMLSLADPGWVRTDAGGPNATHAVESVIPGIVLGAILVGDVNGCRFSAQEYSGLSIGEACSKAKRHMQWQPSRWV